MPHPATLRRAIAFIDENAHTNLTPAGIAAAALVGIRAVQLAFRRHRDTTPTGYLRRVQLDHAPRDRITGGPANESVTAVAYRWGFPSASRFTAYYRQAYGVLPATPCASEARRSVRHALMRTRSLSAGGIRVMAVTGGRQ